MKWHNYTWPVQCLLFCSPGQNSNFALCFGNLLKINCRVCINQSGRHMPTAADTLKFYVRSFGFITMAHLSENACEQRRVDVLLRNYYLQAKTLPINGDHLFRRLILFIHKLGKSYIVMRNPVLNPAYSSTTVVHEFFQFSWHITWWHIDEKSTTPWNKAQWLVGKLEAQFLLHRRISRHEWPIRRNRNRLRFTRRAPPASTS